MATLPTPLRAALGLAAAALEEARKLPEILPQAPVTAVSTAMQVSLRVQQRIAELATRGDELLSQLRGNSSEPPEWATFDEAPEPAPHNGSGRGLAAFDRVPEGSAGDPGDSGYGLAGQPDAGTGPDAESRPDTGTGPAAGTGAVPKPRPAKVKPTLVSAAETIAPVKASPTRAAKAKAAKASSMKATSTKATSAKPVGTKAAKAAAAKTTKATGSKAAGVMATGTKAVGGRAAGKPAKRARSGPVSEPLAVAANRAQPSGAPNPATMAAEIVQAHQATDHQATDHQAGATATTAQPGDGSGTT